MPNFDLRPPADRGGFPTQISDPFPGQRIETPEETAARESMQRQRDELDPKLVRQESLIILCLIGWAKNKKFR